MLEESPEYMKSVGKLAHSRNQQVESYVGWIVFGEDEDRFAVEQGEPIPGFPGFKGVGPRVLHAGEILRIRYSPPVSLPFIHSEKGAIIYNSIVELAGTIKIEHEMQLKDAKVTCADRNSQVCFNVQDAPLVYRRRDSVEFLIKEDVFGDQIYCDKDYELKLHNLVTDFSDVWDEAFVYISSHPEYLQQMHWRKFEELLSVIFRRKGFDVELGPSRADGGVDLRLLYKDSIGPIVTLVQAKRWAQHRKVPIEPVRAFYSIVEDEKANRGLFVSTSEFLPQAKRFAELKAHQLELAGPGVVIEWIRSILGEAR